MDFTPLRQRLYNFMFALLVFGIIIGFMILSNYSYHSFGGFHHMENKLEPIDPVVSTSLPHEEYKKITDSIKQMRTMKNGHMTGTSFDFGFMGAETLVRCDTCDLRSFWDKEGIDDYMIKLGWWQLDTGTFDNPTKYYVKNGQSYLRKGICRPKQIKDNKVVSWFCKETDVPVSFRYDEKKKALMLPVSKSTYKILEPMMIGLGFGTLIFYLYFILASILRVLMDIRKGNPFSDGTIRRLRFLAICSFSIPIIAFSINMLIRLVFSRYFVEDLKLSSEAWSIFLKPFMIGIIVTALYFAFKQGKKLKEDQDLTI